MAPAQNLVSLILCFSILLAVSAIFWQQELRFLLPTPVPAHYDPIAVHEKLQLSQYLESDRLDRPVFLHFFNPGCACSQFNLDHFQRLIREYRGKADIYLVLQSQHPQDTESFREKYKLDIPVILDNDEAIARLCGVYSTPQAVILDQQGRLYYRGNYNKTRYCTLPGSNYAQIALDSLLARKAPPSLEPAAYVAYGCQLPSQQNLKSLLFLNPVDNAK
jgi:peroxiredoxin